MPFGGYSFGGDFFEIVAEQAVDLDGAPALGFVLNVPLSQGLQVEALADPSKRAPVSAPPRPFEPADAVARHRGPPAGRRACRSSLTAACGRSSPVLVGLTRYAALGDSEIRFTVGARRRRQAFPPVTCRSAPRWPCLRDLPSTPMPLSLRAGPACASPPFMWISSGRPNSLRESCSDCPDYFVIDFHSFKRSAINWARCPSSRPSRILRSSGSARL